MADAPPVVPSTDDLLAESAALLRSLEDAAIQQARAWVQAASDKPADAAAARLAALLGDPHGLTFTVAFIDSVVRPEDARESARALRRLAADPPAFLSTPLRLGLRLAGALAPLLPHVVVPAARRVLRSLVRHLVVDARPRHLGRAIAAISASAQGDVRLNLNLLGEAVLGSAEAARRIDGTLALLRREDVDYVSIKVSATTAPHTRWGFDAAVADAVEALRPLYIEALSSPGGPTFINLDMEEYHDLHLTIAVFTTLLSDPALRQAHAGIVLQAYLPDALDAMRDLQRWAARRVRDGGAPVKVRVVKGANLPMERVDADLHDWPLATWGSKTLTDANYKAVLGYALHPAHTAHVRIGVAGHNLFDLALAWELAGVRGVRDAMDVEMLIGMAPQQAAAVRETVGPVLLYTPAVSPREFDVAIAYLVRRLDEGASAENFMSAVAELHDDAVFAHERERFRAALAALPTSVPEPHRGQDRPQLAPSSADAVAQEFRNAPDSDPATPAAIAWARGIRSRIATSSLGQELADGAWIGSAEDLDRTMEAAAASTWKATPAAERAAVLERAAEALEARRADLIEVAAAECGKVIEQTDPEVSEAVDFARYYARSARRLERVDGAAFEPRAVTVVTPPWNFPVAIPAGGMLAALAAGSAVVVKPSDEAARCAAVVVEALWESGVPRDALHYVRLDEREWGEELIAHRRCDQVILTGAYETAALFQDFAPGLRLFAETSGKNAIIVTPSADLDLAAADVVSSAFGHAGQKCSAASLVVLVGSVARSRRFRSQLLDAARSLTVGWPTDDGSRMGPLIAPPRGKLATALTELEPGQRWLLTPQSLDESGRLWSPGIREGVAPGSAFHTTEYFGPVLGVMHAATLDEAIELVNAVDYGLTSGLHSLDEREIQHWMARVQAGNLYVNRSITGAIVERQPFGGWKRSAIGPGAKAGGPHYVATLGRWHDAPAARPDRESADALVAQAATLAAEAGWEATTAQRLAAAWGSDAREWATRRGVVSDPAGLVSEVNAHRYHAVPVVIRARGGDDCARLVRVVGAGVRAGAPLTLSTLEPLPAPVRRWAEDHGVRVGIEDAGQWEMRVAALAAGGGRIRLIDGGREETIAASAGSPALAIYDGEVTSAGEIELHPFQREQAVSITAHRFGTVRAHPGQRIGVPVPGSSEETP